MVFIDRDLELELLESKYNSGKAEMIIVYGVRGIGKTELIKRFLSGKENAYYFFVSVEELNTLLKGFLNVMGYPYAKMSLSSLEEFYEIMGEISKDKRTIFVLDEFQRLVDIEKGALTLLQKVWDEKLRKTKIFLILVGSAVSVIERIGKSYESPLYGRRTGLIELTEFDYWTARLFYPNYNEDSKLITYSILGGIPRYLKTFEDNVSVEENIKNHILTKGSALYDEPEILLLQETRDPSTYVSILKAIAQGYTKFSEISDVSGVEKNKLSKYLDVLIHRLKLVERETPIMEKGRGIYKIKNNFVEFWFKYVLPYKSLLEIGKTDIVLEKATNDIPLVVSRKFEDITRQFFDRINGSKIKGLKISFTRIGRWWKKEKEIDLVAIDETGNTAYFIECKFTKKPADRKTLVELIKKSEEFNWRKNKRKNVYIIVTREKPEIQEEEDIKTLTLNEMVNIAEKKFNITIKTP